MARPVLSVVVQTCAARRELGERLLAKLEATSVRGVDVVGMAVDEEMNGPWASAKLGWQMATGDYHLMLQDDVVLCRDFLDAAKMLTGMCHDRAMSFYVATAAATQAREQGKHWVEMRAILAGQAIALPHAMVGDFLQWEADNAEEMLHVEGFWDDSRLQWFYRRMGIRALVPVPCLVQHNLDVKSQVGTATKVGKHLRRSRWFLGENHSPFSIDWQQGFTSPVRG